MLFLEKKCEIIWLVLLNVVILQSQFGLIIRQLTDEGSIPSSTTKIRRGSIPTPAIKQEYTSRSRAVVARQAHNLKVAGSIPASATIFKELIAPYYFIICSQYMYCIAGFIRRFI